MFKQCTKCLLNKALDCFYKHVKSKDGLRTYCKDCSKKYNHDNKDWLHQKNKDYWKDRPEAFKEKELKHEQRRKVVNKQRYKIDQEFRLKKQEASKRWKEQNKEKTNEYKRNYRQKNLLIVREKEKNRLQNNVNFKLAAKLRSRLRDALKHNYKNGSAVKDLGCSIDFLKIYLESKFKPGMNWDNYTFCGWHIDHIIPLSKFDLTNREELLKACHYTNLQPLWASENFSKGNRI